MIIRILFGIGVTLIVLNIAGLFKSMRNPEIYTEQNTSRVNDVSIPYEKTKESIVKQPGETDKEFAIRINDVVSQSMAHYWKKYHLRVPVWEDYTFLEYIGPMEPKINIIT